MYFLYWQNISVSRICVTLLECDSLSCYLYDAQFYRKDGGHYEKEASQCQAYALQDQSEKRCNELRKLLWW